jgi:hypothetical protein
MLLVRVVETFVTQRVVALVIVLVVAEMLAQQFVLFLVE